MTSFQQHFQDGAGSSNWSLARLKRSKQQTVMQQDMMTASSELPNLAASLSAHGSREAGSARASSDFQATAPGVAPPLKVPTLAFQQLQPEDLRGSADRGNNALRSHRVRISSSISDTLV